MDEAVVCPGCGCAVAQERSERKTVSYDDAVKGALTTNIISLIILAAAAACWLFVSMWIGAALCLVAELVALAPNSKLQKAFKQNGIKNGDKKEVKAELKAITKDLKGRFPAYKISKILAIISLILLIVFALFI